MFSYAGVIYHTVGSHEKEFHFNFLNPKKLSDDEIVECVENGYGVTFGAVTEVFGAVTEVFYSHNECNSHHTTPQPRRGILR